MKLKLVEPLRLLFKDEVRRVGKSLGLPDKFLQRHPFPLFNEVKEKGLPVIAMGHLQATGSEISEDDRSERTVIGGLECVSPAGRLVAPVPDHGLQN